MGNNTKNQHYVPEFYLRRFLNENGKLSVYNVGDNTILENQNPNNYAAQRYFYDVDKDTLLELMEEVFELFPEMSNSPALDDPQFIEHALGRVESEINVIFARIEEVPERLYVQDIQIKLLIFIHEMIYRTEGYRVTIDNIDQQLSSHLENLGLTKQQIDLAKESIGIKKNAKITQLEDIINPSSSLKTGMMLLEGYDWYFGIVNGEGSLIISDNPAQQIYLGFNDICFPISSKTAIIFRSKDPQARLVSNDAPNGHMIYLSTRSVVIYNIVQSSNAIRYVFGKSDDLKVLRGIKRIAAVRELIKGE